MLFSSATPSENVGARTLSYHAGHLKTNSMVFGAQPLLSDTKRPENQVQDVIRRSNSRDFVQCTQGVVEVEQHHLVRHVRSHSILGRVKRSQRVADQFLMAHIGKESAFHLRARPSTDMLQNRRTEFWNAGAGHGRRGNVGGRGSSVRDSIAFPTHPSAEALG